MGVDDRQAARTIKPYDQAVCLGQNNIALDAPIGHGGSPQASLVEGEGPFYAMETQPSYVLHACPEVVEANRVNSITFMYGGVSINAQGHVLTPADVRDAVPVQGRL